MSKTYNLSGKLTRNWLVDELFEGEFEIDIMENANARSSKHNFDMHSSCSNEKEFILMCV